MRRLPQTLARQAQTNGSTGSDRPRASPAQGYAEDAGCLRREPCGCRIYDRLGRPHACPLGVCDVRMGPCVVSVRLALLRQNSNGRLPSQPIKRLKDLHPRNTGFASPSFSIPATRTLARGKRQLGRQLSAVRIPRRRSARMLPGEPSKARIIRVKHITYLRRRQRHTPRTGI